MDGKSDLVCHNDSFTSSSPGFIGISIFESPDSFSYPTQKVWRDTVGPGLVIPISTYDIDKNGINEIIYSGNDETRIYEWQQNIKEVKGER